MGVYGGRTGGQLTISDALRAGYQFLLNPNFSVPILVIGLLVNVVSVALIAPALVAVILGTTAGSEAETGLAIAAILGSFVGAIVTSIVGGVILNLYGQVWATMASEGEAPAIGVAFGRVAERWLNILGAGIIVGLVMLVGMIVLGLIAAALGGVGLIVGLVGGIALIYVAIRLSLASWFAADGVGAMDAVRASWDATNRHLTVVIVWSVVIGIVVAIIGAIAGAILGLIPYAGPALASTIGSAFGFGAGVTLFHRVKDA